MKELFSGKSTNERITGKRYPMDRKDLKKYLAGLGMVGLLAGGLVILPAATHAGSG